MNEREESGERRPDHASYIAAVAGAIERCRGLRVLGHDLGVDPDTGRRTAAIQVAFGPDSLRVEWDDASGWRHERDSDLTRFVDEVVPAPERVTKWVLLLATARHDLYDPGRAAGAGQDVGGLLASY